MIWLHLHSNEEFKDQKPFKSMYAFTHLFIYSCFLITTEHQLCTRHHAKICKYGYKQAYKEFNASDSLNNFKEITENGRFPFDIWEQATPQPKNLGSIHHQILFRRPFHILLRSLTIHRIRFEATVFGILIR